ncbi:SAF domain-containing protein [Lachnospiraceae bacterium 47-T17]
MKRAKKKINPVVFKITSGVLVVALAGTGFFSYKKVQELNAAHNDDRAALQAQITAMQRSGYVAASDVKMGSMLTEDMLIYRTDIPSDLPQETFITVEDLGKTLVVDVSAGMPIYTTEVSEELASNYTERECSFIYLNANMKDSDYVDVRIMFPNGEDYIVASKKCLKSPNVFYNSCYLWLTEAENDLLSAAIVDANINGAKIYVNRYVNPAVQDANIVTYNPNADVIAAMKLNPNIVDESEASLSETARRDVEKRLAEFKELYPEYIIDDQIVDDISRQDFITGTLGDDGSIPNPDENSGAFAGAVTESPEAIAPVDDTSEEEINYVE